MQNAINFCSNAINKDLPYFYIKDKRIYAYNGAFTMSAPLDLPDCSPKAEQLVGAFKNQVSANVTKTPTGKLSIKNGKLKALVNCSETFLLNTDVPEGEVVELNCDLLLILKRLLPFTIQSDFKWMDGVVLSNNYAYAANNPVIIRHFTGLDVDMWISTATIKALLKVKEPIESITVSKNTIIFNFTNDKWLSQNNYSGAIPDLAKMLNDVTCDNLIPEEFFTGIDYLKPFVDENFSRVIISDGKLSTVDGTDYELPVTGSGSFNITNLSLLRDVATNIDFTKNNFTGVDIQGKIHGYRD